MTLPLSFRRCRIAGLTFLLLLTIATPFFNSPRLQAATDTKIVYQKWIDARTVDVYVHSSLTDSYVKEVRLLLPTGWSADAAKKWPALWLLHGGGDNYESWTKGTDIEELSAARGMIVVIPNTSWCSSYSDWYNDGVYGSPAWETYLTSDLRWLLDRTYHADGNNAAVAGLSMGGLGAMKLAMHHPDMFKAVASFSGNLDPLHAYNNTADSPDPPTIGCMGFPDWRKVWGDYRIPQQRAIWERNDPYVQADKFAQMHYIFISTGDGLSDPLNSKTADDFLEKKVNPETRAMVARLQERGILADADFYAGTHSWPYWQIELHKAWPGLLQAMDVQ